VHADADAGHKVFLFGPAGVPKLITQTSFSMPERGKDRQSGAKAAHSAAYGAKSAGALNDCSQVGKRLGTSYHVVVQRAVGGCHGLFGVRSDGDGGQRPKVC
jgi:hypothetical protein